MRFSESAVAKVGKSTYTIGVEAGLNRFDLGIYKRKCNAGSGDDDMIPIKIETLLEGRKVEQNRIEYKEGFNPSDIVHTICAYANDIAGVDGGYLVIGVKAEDGIPVLPPVGLSRESLDEIQLKIFQYCNKIEPRYIPKIDVVEYKGANLIYLKCVAGDAGPYQAPVDVYSRKEAGKEQNRTMKNLFPYHL